MSAFFDIMLAPFVECMVLVGIHAYLGIHVLKRRVIFVDLSLAQIAALGTTVGILFGIHDTESMASLLFALGFTVIGAAVFAVSRYRDERVPQEAIIGLVYAITAAVAVLVVGKIQGVEHLVNIMHGRLLWVRWSEVVTAASVYLVVAAVHLLLRKRFMQISEDPEAAYREGVNVRLWDFLFYMTFGFVISISVRVAGVLLVFVFLVAPAVMAFMITSDFKRQLALGWITGTMVCTVGIYLSWVLDMPCGPTVVAFYGVALATIGVVLYVVRAARTGAALGHVAAGVACVCAASGVFFVGGRVLADTRLAGSEYGHAPHCPVEHEAHDHDAPEVAHAEHQVGAVPAAAEVPQSGLERYAAMETCLERMTYLQEIATQDRATAAEWLFLFLADAETSPFCRAGAIDLLRTTAGQDFGFDPDQGPLGNLEPLTRYREWLGRPHEL